MWSCPQIQVFAYFLFKQLKYFSITCSNCYPKVTKKLKRKFDEYGLSVFICISTFLKWNLFLKIISKVKLAQNKFDQFFSSVIFKYLNTDSLHCFEEVLQIASLKTMDPGNSVRKLKLSLRKKNIDPINYLT